MDIGRILQNYLDLVKFTGRLWEDEPVATNRTLFKLGLIAAPRPDRTSGTIIRGHVEIFNAANQERMRTGPILQSDRFLWSMVGADINLFTNLGRLAARPCTPRRVLAEKVVFVNTFLTATALSRTV